MLVSFKTGDLYKCGKEVRINPDTVSFLIALNPNATQIGLTNGEKIPVMQGIQQVEDRLYGHSMAIEAKNLNLNTLEQIRSFNEDIARAGGKRSTAALEQITPSDEPRGNASFIDDSGLKKPTRGKKEEEK